MANLYTKAGDKGKTGLYGGSRIDKDDLRVSSYGTVDESISSIGFAYSIIENEDIKIILHNIQERLFSLGAELASDEKGKELLKNKITDDEVSMLEKIIDCYTEKIGKFSGFVVPGKSQSSAALHVARTVVRRAERNITTLSKTVEVRETLRKYINRLSDVIYALARSEEEDVFLQTVKKKVLKELKKKLDYDILTLDVARKMALAAEEKALQLGLPIVFSVVDEFSNLMLFNRMKDAILVSNEISMNKAYTSVILKISTDKIAPLVQPGAPLYGLKGANNRIITFGGGYPIVSNNKVIGGIGVSGGSVEQDMEIALAALKIFEIERG